MLAAVKLNGQCGGIAVKIQDAVSQNFLPRKAWNMSTEKIVPEMAFFLGHFPAQRPCIAKQLIIAGQTHGGYLLPFI